MARIKQLFLLWSMFQATFAFKGHCSKPDFKVKNIDLSEITDAYFEVGQRLRLKCQSGYKRKAGTSNLIRCQNNSKQAKWSEPNLKCITTSVEPTSVHPPTSAATPGAFSDHYTASTMDIKIATETLASHLSSALTTLTALIESTTFTAPPESVSGCNQTSSSPPLSTHTKGLGPLATTWTAVRPSSSSTAETEFPAPGLSDSTQKAAAETAVTYSTNGTTGTEPITSKTALAERTVNPSTASETASDVTGSIGTTDINQLVTSDRNIGLIVGTSTSSFTIALCALFFLWIFVYRKKISCKRSQEYHLTPIEVQTVTSVNETEPLHQETES
ncbi:interleukin-15 receptor subunit alpha isoform X1 [Hemiscyllium ocellatum]|uniref:interleukin-15 receptor subunit alpha isoform X1 n=1 Tax=Hemiscyllium ocellatum TaxID=170820 RepID=UPI00296640E6|nr:interleukin-15 receptor subunit alpha isoform X1 [Hemiscyllium ocellatum]